MAKTRRSSIDNMFAKKGSVQPQKKEIIKEEPQVQEPEKIEVKEATEVEEKIVEEVVEETEIKEPETVEPIKIEEPKTESIKKPAEKKEQKVNRPAAIDNLFTKKKRERGHQQTIYLKKEVYDFCNEIAEQYEIGMSDVVNKLILSFMEDIE